MIRIFWDINIGLNEINSMLDDKAEKFEEKTESSIYRRLLMSCDWYTLLKLVSEKKLREILNDSMIRRLYPKDIQSRFVYARDVLSR